MHDQILVSRRVAANALSISIRKLDYLIAEKEIQVKRIGRRCLIPRRSLEEFARRDHPNHIAMPTANPQQDSADREPNEHMVILSEEVRP
jgi:excisionase family DNA binding protein